MATTVPSDTVLYINESTIPTATNTIDLPTTLSPPSPPPQTIVTPVTETKPVSLPTPVTDDKPVPTPSVLTVTANNTTGASLNAGSTSIGISEDPSAPKPTEDEALLKDLEKLGEVLKDEKTAQTIAQAAVCMFLCGSVCSMIVLGFLTIIPRKLFIFFS